MIDYLGGFFLIFVFGPIVLMALSLAFGFWWDFIGGVIEFFRDLYSTRKGGPFL